MCVYGFTSDAVSLLAACEIISYCMALLVMQFVPYRGSM